MAQFANRLGRVLTVYTSRHWLLLGLLGLAVLLAIQFSMEYTSDPHRIGEDSLPLVGLPALTLPWILVLLVKPQFAHPRAALMPGFSAPHLAIPAIVLFTLLLAFPALVAVCTNCDPLGLSAFTFAVAVPVLWGMHTLRTVAFLAAMAVVFSAANEDAVKNWWALPNNDLAAVRLLIVVAGLAASVAWLWRLCQLREEMADYETPVTWRSGRASRCENATDRRLFTRQFGHNRLTAVVGDWWHGQRLAGDTHSFRGRMRLLEYGVGAWPATISSLAFAAAVLLLGVLAGELFRMRWMLHAQLTLILLWILNVAPWEKFRNHRPQVVGELMFPMTRTQLIDGLFATVARHVGALWIAGCTAALLVVALIPYESTTLPAIGTLLLFAASMELITFGLGAIVATWTSRLLQFFVMAACIGIVIGLAHWWIRLLKDVGPIPILLLILLQLGIGLAIIKKARHKWLTLELG